MNTKNKRSENRGDHEKLVRMTSLTLLTAIVAVLQLLGSSFRIGVIPFSLVLVPIVIGACLFGIGAGAFLGGVFGVICLIGGITGTDSFTFLIWNVSPFWTSAICMVKGVACGAVSGLCYQMLKKRQTLACIAAAVVCPVVNTGIFALFMLTAFRGVLADFAAQSGTADAFAYLLVGMIGVNFLVELAINGVLSAAITRVIRYAQKRRE